MKRRFTYIWVCDACETKVSGTKILGAHQQDYTLQEVHNLIMVTLDPQCKECRSMGIGRIIFLQEVKP